MNDYEQRPAARIPRLQAKSTQLAEEAQADRRYRDRIHRKHRKACELSAQATEAAAKNRAISSDAPEAIAKDATAEAVGSELPAR